MTYNEHTAAVHRAERIDSAHQLVAHLFQLEKERLVTRDALSEIACSLVKVHGLSLVDAASICGMTRQALSRDLRIQDLRGDTGDQA